MKIVFQEPQKTPDPIFGEVTINQFFIDLEGRLCQKVYYNKYNIIAEKDGKLWAGSSEMVSPNARIQRILPLVERIEF
jgi:hypothetical protein